MDEESSSLLSHGFGLLRDSGRLRTIAQVLLRHGLADLVQRTGVAKLLEAAGERLHAGDPASVSSLPAPVRVRLALQELGPTFIKLGQILSTRVDLFAPEWITELERLQDQVTAVAFADLERQLTEDLGSPPDEVFAFIDPQPLAAASIGQVHRARLNTGDEVVLKIRRPGIRSSVEADLRLLARLARIADQEIPWLARVRAVDLVRQFSDSLRQELDLAAECRNAQRAAENIDANDNISVPGVYWEWCSERLNVQEFISGIPARDLAGIQAAGLDPARLARHGAHALLEMILRDGFFHADPHAGNIFVRADGSIVIIDWGMVGRISEIRRRQVLKLLLGLIARDARSTSRVLLEWAGTPVIDEDLLLAEVDIFIERYHGVPLKELKLLVLLGDVTRILRSHQLTLPPDLALVIKALGTIEGLGRMLNPEFQIVEEAEPVLRELVRQHYGPEAMARRGWDVLRDGIDLLSELPREIRQLTQGARRGQLRLGIDMTQVDKLGQDLNRAANRLAIGLVTSACILGTAIISATAERSGSGMASLGAYVLLGAGIGGVWLLLSIWRSGHH